MDDGALKSRESNPNRPINPKTQTDSRLLIFTSPPLYQNRPIFGVRVWHYLGVGVAHLRDGYSIKQEVSSANALPSLFSGIVVVNRRGFGICGFNAVKNKISSANAKPSPMQYGNFSILQIPRCNMMMFAFPNSPKSHSMITINYRGESWRVGHLRMGFFVDSTIFPQMRYPYKIMNLILPPFF